jgi:hypothetical protein
MSRLSVTSFSFRWTAALVLAALLLGSTPGSAQAQSPVSTVKDNQGNDLMQIFDNGNLELFQNGNLTLPGTVESTGAGFVLPDGTTLAGSGDLGSFSLAFSGTASTSDPAFEIENTGSGHAFSVTGASADGLNVDGAGSDGVEVTNSNYGFYARGVSSDGALLSNAGKMG